MSSELSLTLNNSSGKFNDIIFEGSELFLEIGIKDYADSYIPCGRYTVDEPPRAFSKISIKSLDFMMRFDKTADISALPFPCNPEDLVRKMAELCDVEVSEDLDFSTLPNNEESIYAPDTADVTYRQLLQWVAEITGTCAYMDYNGKLMLSWFVDTSIDITPAVRYSGDVLENDITITGVTVKTQENAYESGENNTYPLVIEGNELIYADTEEYKAQRIAEVIIGDGFTYRPYECSGIPMPYLWPLDRIVYTDKNGNKINTVITNHTFGLNGVSVFSAQGETQQKKSYAAQKSLTKKDLNEAIAKALEGIENTAEHLYIKYSAYSGGVDPDGNISWSDTPDTDTEYIGTCASDADTAPPEPADYKWVKVKGEDGQDGSPGGDGQDGKGIASYLEYYASSNSSSEYNKGSYQLEAVSKTSGVGDAVLGEDGFYSVDMNSLNSSYSLVKLIFTVNKTTDIVINCINYAESNYDYMLVSKISTSESEYKFSETYSVTGDANLAQMDFKSSHSSQPQAVTFTGVSPGIHYVYIKIRKDTSTTRDYETFAFKVDDMAAQWQTSIPAEYGANEPYLWNYTYILYTDGSEFSSTPQVIAHYGADGADGADGENGRGISSITEYYCVTATATAPDESSFGTDIVTPTEETPFLWNYEVIAYTDSSEPFQSEIRLIGVYGEKGNKGDDGSTYYTWVKYADDDKGTNMSDSSEGKAYIGIAYNKATETESTTASDYTWAKFKGEDGQDGDDGVSVSEIVTQYYRSTSDLALSGGSWTTTMPEFALNYYLWKREKTTFDNKTVKYSAEVLDTSWNGLNAVDTATKQLNENLANALGLYVTETTVSGSTIRYYHSNRTLTSSASGDVILVFNANGFGVCNTGWNGGSPAFSYGSTFDGKAVWDILSANKISANLIKAGVLKSLEGAAIESEFSLNTGKYTLVSGSQNESFGFGANKDNHLLLQYNYSDNDKKGVKLGYYYGGAFYSDSAHTEKLEAASDYYYGDQSTGKFYEYSSSSFTELSDLTDVLQSLKGFIMHSAGVSVGYTVLENGLVYLSDFNSPEAYGSVYGIYSGENSEVDKTPVFKFYSYADESTDGSSHYTTLKKQSITTKYLGAEKICFYFEGKAADLEAAFEAVVESINNLFNKTIALEETVAILQQQFVALEEAVGQSHTHTEASAVKENEVAATCTSSGSYDRVVYCATCGEEISRTTVTVNATGHSDSNGDGYCDKCGAVVGTFYTVSTAVSPTGSGAVTGGGSYLSGASAKLTATANSGYVFKQWSDGVTTNPRTITVTANKTYTAVFEVESSGSDELTITEGVTTAVECAEAKTYYLKFVPKYTGTYTFKSLDQETLDPDGCLYDSDKNEIDDAYDGNSGAFNFTYNCTAGVTYYLGISLHNGLGTINVLVSYEGSSSGGDTSDTTTIKLSSLGATSGTNAFFTNADISVSYGTEKSFAKGETYMIYATTTASVTKIEVYIDEALSTTYYQITHPDYWYSKGEFFAAFTVDSSTAGKTVEYKVYFGEGVEVIVSAVNANTTYDRVWITDSTKTENLGTQTTLTQSGQKIYVMAETTSSSRKIVQYEYYVDGELKSTVSSSELAMAVSYVSGLSGKTLEYKVYFGNTT